MTTAIKNYFVFLFRCGRVALRGDWRYHLWIAGLFAVSLVGLNAYAKQLVHGLIMTNMSDQVSWGVYIANFTFLVGVAAAGALMVVPVYIYKSEEQHDLVILGSILAVTAMIMSLAFVMVDVERPDRSWHMIPIIGKFNFPGSMLAWDVVMLNGYLALNIYICGYLIYCRYAGRKPSRWFYIPFVLVAVVWAVSIHTLTAFLFVGLGGRPYWNSSIVGPRFIASAFASGPALLILALQTIRRVSDYKIADRALFTLRHIMQVSMIVNVFLLLNEMFKQFYTGNHQASAARYLFLGLNGHHALVPWIWSAVALNVGALILLILPVSRSLRWLDAACLMAIVGIWIEKGMGLVIPGFVPTPLGEVVDYTPTWNETLVCFGIWAFGALCFTLLLRMTLPILQGRLTINATAN